MRSRFRRSGRRRRSCVAEAARLPAAHEALERELARDRPRLQPLPRRLRARPPERLGGTGPCTSARSCSKPSRSRSTPPRRRPTGSSTRRSAGRCASPGTTGASRRSAPRRRARSAPVSRPSRAGARVELDRAPRDDRVPARGRARPRRDREGARGRPRAPRGGRGRRAPACSSASAATSRSPGAPPTGGWPVRVADDHAAALDGAGPVGRDRGRRPRHLGHDRPPLAGRQRRAAPHHRPAHRPSRR